MKHLLFFLPLFPFFASAQILEKQFVATVQYSGFTQINDSLYRGDLIEFRDVLIEGYQPSGVDSGFICLDGTGRAYRIEVVNSFDYSSLNVDLIELDDYNEIPIGVGIVAERYGSTYQIPNGLVNSIGISSVLQAKILNHNTKIAATTVQPPDTLYLKEASGVTAISDGDTINLVPYLLKSDTTSMLVRYIERGDTTTMLDSYLKRPVGWGLSLLTGKYPFVDSSKVASRYYVSTSPTTIANNYIATSNGSNLVARNLFDNNTYVGILNNKPFMLGQWTTAGRPTGVTGYIGDNSTNDWIERYSATAGAWIPPLQASSTGLAGGKGTAGSILYIGSDGRATQDNTNLNYTGNILTTRRSTTTGIMAQFGNSAFSDNFIIEALSPTVNSGRRTWRIGAPSQEGGVIESMSGNGGIVIYGNRNLGNNGMFARSAFGDNTWIVGPGGIHDGLNIWFRVNNNSRVAMSIAADENINFASSGPNGVPNRSATNLKISNDRVYNNKGIDILSTLSATADNQIIAAYAGLPNFVNQTTSIRTVTIVNAGTSVTNGTYNNIALSGGTGYGAVGNVVVSGGIVTSVTIVNGGGGYAVNDIVYPAPAVVGNGSTVQIRVSTIGTSTNPVYAIFHGRQPATGQNYYNILADGAAKNFLAGDVIIGSDSAIKYSNVNSLLTIKKKVQQVDVNPGVGILEFADPFGVPGIVTRSSSPSVANKGFTLLTTDAGVFTLITAKRNDVGFSTVMEADSNGVSIGDPNAYTKRAALTIASYLLGDTAMQVRNKVTGSLSFWIRNDGTFGSTYGDGAREAADFGFPTPTHIAAFVPSGAGKGTIVDYPLSSLNGIYSGSGTLSQHTTRARIPSTGNLLFSQTYNTTDSAYIQVVNNLDGNREVRGGLTDTASTGFSKFRFYQDEPNEEMGWEILTDDGTGTTAVGAQGGNLSLYADAAGTVEVRGQELRLNNGEVSMNQYGQGNMKASDLSATDSKFVAKFGDAGKVLDYYLARDTFIEDVTLFSVGTLMNDCQELTIVSSMTSTAPTNQEIRFPDAADYLRGKKIIVYSKKKDAGAYVPYISVVGGVSRLFYTTNPGIGGIDPSNQAYLYIDDGTWSDHGTTFEFTCLKIDNTPSYRWVLKQR